MWCLKEDALSIKHQLCMLKALKTNVIVALCKINERGCKNLEK